MEMLNCWTLLSFRRTAKTWNYWCGSYSFAKASPYTGVVKVQMEAATWFVLKGEAVFFSKMSVHG